MVPSASTVAVPFAGALTTAGGPASPRSLAAMSTFTATPSVVVAVSSVGSGAIVMVTVPVSHRLGLPLSQPVTTNVSMPVKAPVGIHSNEPSGPTVAVPCAAGVVSDAVTTWPRSGSLIGTRPVSRWVGIQSVFTSSTTGGWLGGGAASTTVVTFAFELEPSLFPGRPSIEVEVAETTATSVPEAGAVPVTVKIRVAPTARAPTVHVTAPPPTTPPPSAATPLSAGGRASATTTPLAVIGPRLTAAIV